MVNKTVVLLDTAFAVRAYAAGDQSGTPEPRWNPKDTGIRRVLRALSAEHRPLRVPSVPGSALAHGCLAIPIAVGDTKLGYLLVLDEANSADPDDTDLLIASYTSTLFALTLAHEKTNTDLGLRYQGAVVDALVSGHFLDSDDARQKALTLGIADGQPYRVALLRVGSYDEVLDHRRPLVPNIIEEVIAPLTNSVTRAVAVARGSELVMILSSTTDDHANVREHTHNQAAAVLTRLSSLLRARSITTTPTCGLSEPTSRPDRAPQHLQQAEHAVQLGLRLGRVGQVISYDGLGIYRLLLQIGDMRHLLRFAEDVLGSLIAYEATHKLELVRTLSVYLKEHESLKQTARRLRVHANTISYRIQRIEQLTQLDLNNSEDRLAAHVAVKIIESHQNQRPVT
ncbi:helix-turn-helix domain-containing protein [Streptomyces sp. NPDC005708]|uniref:PucR family transcriptional regulator n=1 Tax=Streptomyces sp. NPDC005708 TaxID=3154564 RepID=UPI0033FFB409